MSHRVVLKAQVSVHQMRNYLIGCQVSTAANVKLAEDSHIRNYEVFRSLLYSRRISVCISLNISYLYSGVN